MRRCACCRDYCGIKASANCAKLSTLGLCGLYIIYGVGYECEAWSIDKNVHNCPEIIGMIAKAEKHLHQILRSHAYHGDEKHTARLLIACVCPFDMQTTDAND